jgi:hypothetical protein
MLRTTLFLGCSALLVSLASCGPSGRDCVGDECSNENGGSNGGSNGGMAACDSGAYDFPGDGIDNDCDGTVDNPPGPCDSGLNAASTNGSDFAKAIDICQVSNGTSWGLISAAYSQSNGMGNPAASQHYLGPNFGPGVLPKTGASLAILGTGPLRGGGANGWADFAAEKSDNQVAGFPSDWLAANHGMLPSSTACGSGFLAPMTPAGATSPMMMTLKIKVPTNAASFTMNVNFFSAEFPEYVCSPFNDFFVVLLDSTYSGTPANPTDKNLAFYTPDMGATKYPVGVNLAATNKGLFSQCINGSIGCAGDPLLGLKISTCMGTNELAGNEMSSDAAACDGTEGGGTGWLQTSGNVVPGETITLRIATWNTSDNALQSLAVIDGFQWNPGASMPGTTIFLDRPPMPTSGGPALDQAQIVSEEASQL